MTHHRIWLAAALAAGGLTMTACATHDEAAHAKIDAATAQAAQTNAAQDVRIDAASADAQAALARAEAAHKLATGDFQHSVLYTDDSVTFDTNSSTLSSDAQASLTAFAEKLKTENKNVYVEIQGHADSRGSEKSNQALGHARAVAAMNFLNTQGVPLHRMTATSFGETKSKGTSEAEDRRVVLVVVD